MSSAARWRPPRRARLRVHAGRPAARRPAGGGRRRVADDHARHRHRADAGHRRIRWWRKGCTTAPSSTATCVGWPVLRGAICWARPTASRRTPPGPPPIAGIAADAHRRAGAPPGRASARWSPSRIRCSAPSMASSRSGWACVLAAVLGQIGLPGGGFDYALGAIGHYGRRVQRRADCRRCRRGATASATSSRSPASPTCC